MATSLFNALAFGSKRITNQGLRRLNLAAAALNAVQGILILILRNSHLGAQSVTSGFLTSDNLASDAAGHKILAPGAHHLFDLNLAYVVAVFFFLAAIFQLAVATRYQKQYQADLKIGINRARCLEYCLAGGTVMLTIALLVGISDLATLILIFGLTALMNLANLVTEKYNQGQRGANLARLSFWTSMLSGFLPWLAIALYVWASYAFGSGLPGYIYWTFFSLLVLAAFFAGNVYRRYKKLGAWKDYLYAERAYIILGLLIKAALGWQIFAGALR